MIDMIGSARRSAKRRIKSSSAFLLAALALAFPLKILPTGSLTSSPLADGIAEPTWRLIYEHDFRSGHAPNWGGWGDSQLVEEGLWLHPGEEYCGLYFFPVNHRNNFMIEATVKIVASEGATDVQLLTRDGPAIGSESGIVLYFDTRQGSVRHMVSGTDYVYDFFSLPFRVEMNRWYTMSLAFYRGRIEAYVDGKRYFRADGGLPAHEGLYTEPHVAVFYGAAIFQIVRVYEPAETGELVGARINFEPNVLRSESKRSSVSVFIGLPNGYDVSQIDVSTILLNGLVSPASTDRKGQRLVLRFDRASVYSILEVGDHVLIEVTGKLSDGTPFRGRDYIKVM